MSIVCHNPSRGTLFEDADQVLGWHDEGGGCSIAPHNETRKRNGCCLACGVFRSSPALLCLASELAHLSTTAVVYSNISWHNYTRRNNHARVLKSRNQGQRGAFVVRKRWRRGGVVSHGSCVHVSNAPTRHHTVRPPQQFKKTTYPPRTSGWGRGTATPVAGILASARLVLNY